MNHPGTIDGVRIERIGFEQVVAAAADLAAIGEESLLADIRADAYSFFSALGAYRRSAEYRDRLRAPNGVSSDRIVLALQGAWTTFNLAEPNVHLTRVQLARRADDCGRLAAAIASAMVAVRLGGSVVVKIDPSPEGLGELVVTYMPKVGRTRRRRTPGSPKGGA